MQYVTIETGTAVTNAVVETGKLLLYLQSNTDGLSLYGKKSDQTAAPVIDPRFNGLTEALAALG